MNFWGDGMIATVDGRGGGGDGDGNWGEFWGGGRSKGRGKEKRNQAVFAHFQRRPVHVQLTCVHVQRWFSWQEEKRTVT